MQRARTASSCAWSRPRTSSPRLAADAAPRARRSSASPPSTAATRSAAPAPSCERKGADLIVLNDVSDPAIGFESAENAVTLIDADGEIEVPIASKDAIAEAILDRVDAAAARKRAEPAG